MEYLFYHKRKRSYQIRNLQKIKGYKSIVENAKLCLNSKNIYIATNGVLLISGRSIINIINDGGDCMEHCITDTDKCVEVGNLIKEIAKGKNIRDFLFETNAITSFLFGDSVLNICDLRKLYASIYERIYNESKKSASTWFFMNSLNHLELETSLYYQKYYIDESK
jgi:hypothetical protein